MLMSLSLVVVLFLVFYLTPTMIGALRKHADLPAIAAVNILFGWTLAGWVVAFIWSLADPAGRGRGTQTVVIHNQQALAVEPPRYAPPPVLAGGHMASAGVLDMDTTFWDGLRDKSDPDLLEEYLARFPGGRFSQLARGRLERRKPDQQLMLEDARPVITAPRQPSFCTNCGVVVHSASRFCTECGMPVDGS
jgi:hypothetical protein